MPFRLFLEPLDVWLFRDARPFTAGSDSIARSRFPPTPYTVYGMLRSLLLFRAAARGAVRNLAFGQEAEAIARAVGGPGDFERLRLRGPLPGRRVDGRVRRYFPVPRDVVQWADREGRPGGERGLLAPAVAVPLGGSVSTRLQPLWSTKRGARVEGHGWIAEDDFWAYLAGVAPPVHPAERLYVTEPRPGLGRDRQKGTAAEHLLYVADYVRPLEGAGLVVDVLEGLDEAPPGLIAFGGEARGTRCSAYRLEADPQVPSLRQAVAERGRIRLVLATPALFARGWLPSWVDPQRLETDADQPALRLVAAAVPRPEPIGGFDLVRRAPRPLLRAVPAGSVYFFAEREPGAAAAAFDRWFGRCVSDQQAGIGFGLSYAGPWDPAGPAE